MLIFGFHARIPRKTSHGCPKLGVQRSTQMFQSIHSLCARSLGTPGKMRPSFAERFCQMISEKKGGRLNRKPNNMHEVIMLVLAEVVMLVLPCTLYVCT